MPASEPKKQPGIFISYRRSDTPDAVGRIYDRLVSEFGKARVFKDVDSIPLGQDFRGHLNDIISGCVAVLAIVGPKWTDIRNEAGQKRLDDPDDFVRIELEAALARSVPVVPVLVGHAPMPGTSQLPSSLSSLAFRQSIEVRPDPDFHNDATRLVSALRAIIDPNAPQVVAPPHAIPRQSSSLWLVAVAVTATLAALVLAFPAASYLRQAPTVEIRTDIVTPSTESPRDFALSPDGRQIVFVASGNGVSRLWLRSLTTADTQPLMDTDGATSPFWSPDSRAIAFFSRGRLRRLDLAAGAVQTLTEAPAGNGGSWGMDGSIIYSVGPGATPLLRVPATGGTGAPITKIASQNAAHRWPQWLPGGQQFLFYDGAVGQGAIYLGSLGNSSVKLITPSESAGTFRPPDWLLWVREGALVAQRVDLKKAELVGNAVTVASGIEVDGISWGIPVSVDAGGQIAYRTGRVGSMTQLTWVDRSGEVTGTIGEPGTVSSNPRVSPDGRRVALDLFTRNNADIWLLEGTRSSRLTFEPSEDERPLWSADGERLIYRTRGADGNHLYQRSASGSGEPELLMSSNRVIIPTSLSPDGRFLLFFEAVGTNTVEADLRLLPLTGERKPFVLWRAPQGQSWGSISPDGKWMAYQSGGSSQFEIFVRPFTPAGSATGQWQVSRAGGALPIWRRDGKEIYYLDPDGAMMAAAFSVVGASPSISPPVKLFQTRVLGGGGFGLGAALGRQFDVAPDGRFLVNSIVDTYTAPPITLIQNWNPDVKN